ncbi:hypothetical protein K402DRAFT_389512 [Aulographum hederae CBS 113979]|uniref:YAG7-like dimerisation domain-containing protein n=1 Tax=Aulographum hederae CBS 113979 TaxID=1176131 RepID=A0A6G1HBP9_9PEZI|nr:hypothetical protein K402DRAFT_389512 [Aulographum hederae CBS 113979]
MSGDAATTAQQAIAPDSKTGASRKKKSKAAPQTATPQSPTVTKAESVSHDGHANGVDGSEENAFIMELRKKIRNTTKKLNSMQKTDAIIAENPTASLDNLVTDRKINSEQKAQMLKKPVVQAQLTHFEEQLSLYKKLDQEFQQKLAAEKEQLQAAHEEELEKLRDSMKAETTHDSQRTFKHRLLTFSRFLRAAAARRANIEDDSDVTKAFEGALLLVYGGDPAAVAAAEKLIDASEEKVPGTDGLSTEVSFAEIHNLALEEAPFAAEEAWVDDVALADAAPPESDPSEATQPAADPTIVNAGMTEIEDENVVTGSGAEMNGHTSPAAGNIDTGAANEAAETQWDAKAASSDDPLAESFEMIPRPADETEAPHTTAANNSTQSWADDAPVPAPNASNAPNGANDGFKEVDRHPRGRGERGGYRGRGGDRPRGGGDRGRGGPRGGRGRGGDGERRGGRGGGGRGGGARGRGGETQ